MYTCIYILLPIFCETPLRMSLGPSRCGSSIHDINHMKIIDSIISINKDRLKTIDTISIARKHCKKSRWSRKTEQPICGKISGLKHNHEVPIFGKMSRFWHNPEVPIFGKISRFWQKPELPIFGKICHFRNFINGQISGKIGGFVRNSGKIWDFWQNDSEYSMNCRDKSGVSDRGAHFWDKRSVLCNNLYI